MIVPNLAPSYYNEQDRGILTYKNSVYAQAVTHNLSFWQEANIDTRFEAGDQTVWNELYGNVPAFRRSQYNFNRVRRIVNVVDGYQRRNRKSFEVIPRENGDQMTADQYTKVMMWAAEENGIYDTISSAFHGALVTGMNMLHIWMDYRSDPINGDIKVTNCAYNTFLIDPFFKRPDLSDCNYIIKRSYLSKREIISLMPDKVDIIMELLPTNNNGSDGKFQFMPENYNYSMQNLLIYDEFYYRTFRTQKVIVDTTTGETTEWKGNDDDDLEAFISQYPELAVIKQDIPTVNVAITVEDRVLYDGPNPMGIDEYPFVPVFAYYHPELADFGYRIQGMVRGLRDAQYLYNRRKIIELDILESQVNSGYIYKENALVNPSDIFLQGQGKGLALKEDANMTDVLKIEPGQVPPSMIQLSEILAREIQEISGVNEELLGSATDDKAGILSMLRQGAGLTTLQILFDQLDNSQKLLGNLMLKLIQTNFTPGKIARIIEEEPAPQFYNQSFGKYDASVVEGLNTTTQRQMQFAQMLQLREVGVPIPDDELLNAATIQNKGQIVEAIKKQQEAQQQQMQQQSQLQAQELQSRIELAQARTVADKGLGIERISRVKENQALAEERQAEAQKDDAKAVLDTAKAIKEMNQIDLDSFQKFLALAAMIEDRKNSQEAPEEVSEETSVLEETTPEMGMSS